MKLKTKPRLKPGPKESFGGPKETFYPGNELLELIAEFQTEARIVLKMPVKKAMIYREGIKLFIDKYRPMLDASKKGELHAKKRNSFFDQVEKSQPLGKKLKKIPVATFRKNKPNKTHDN